MIIAGLVVLSGVLSLIFWLNYKLAEMQLDSSQAQITEIGNLLTSVVTESRRENQTHQDTTLDLLTHSMERTIEAVAKELYGERNAVADIEQPAELAELYKSNWYEEVNDIDPATPLERDPIGPDFRPDIIAGNAPAAFLNIDLAGEEYEENGHS